MVCLEYMQTFSFVIPWMVQYSTNKIAQMYYAS